MAAAAPAGFIEFGASNVADVGGGNRALARTRVIRPETGAMLLFPSYFWHRTIPFESDQERISVAFDVVPRSPASDESD